MKTTYLTSVLSLAGGLHLVACAPPRPVHDPAVDASMVAAARERARRGELTVADPGTRLEIQELRALMAKNPGQAAKVATEKHVLQYFRQRKLVEGAYLATYWVPITRSALAALVDDPGSLTESQFLSALDHLRKSCGDPRACSLDSLNFFPLVRKDWSQAVAYLLRWNPSTAASLNAVDGETGESPLNVAKSSAMIAALTAAGARARTPEEIAVVRAEQEAKLAQEKLEKEIERLEELEEKREKQRLADIEDEKRQAAADAQREQDQKEAQERQDQKEAAWRAASDGLDKFKAQALADRAAVQQQRLNQIQSGSSQPTRTPSSNGSGGSSGSSTGQDRVAAMREELARKRQLAESARIAAAARLDADRRAAADREKADREKADRGKAEQEQKAAQDAQIAARAATPAATSSSRSGPECSAQYSETVTGKVPEYYAKELSLDLARTTAANQAAAACTGRPVPRDCTDAWLSPKIEHGTTSCKKHPHDDTYACEVKSRFWCMCKKCM
jgi:hypothetical protein